MKISTQESKFESFKRDTKEADALVDSLDEDIDAETKERNRLQGEKNKTVAAAKRELDALRADQMELANLEKDMEKYRGSGYDAQLEEHKNKVSCIAMYLNHLYSEPFD